MSDKNSSSRNSTKPVLAAVLDWCGIIEFLLLVMLLILKVWVDDDWWINRLLLTDLILLIATGFMYAVDRHSRENSG